MNTPDENLRFDRLVDGELNEEERRNLLTGLDNEPDGWRRCALAFLESQCWRQSLGALAFRKKTEAPKEPEEIVLPMVDTGAPRSARRAPWIGRSATAAAMAASFLVMWMIGSWVQRTGTRPSGGVENQVAVQNGGPVDSSQNRDAGATRLVRVSSPGVGTRPGFSLDVPAVERDRVDEKWLHSAPSAIPDNVAQALGRTGHEVRQRREFVPVLLKDGRQLVMPVDQVDVHYVGNRTY